MKQLNNRTAHTTNMINIMIFPKRGIKHNQIIKLKSKLHFFGKVWNKNTIQSRESQKTKRIQEVRKKLRSCPEN